MRERRNHEWLKRPEDKFGVEDLCAYAHDILLTIGEDPAQTGRVTASWSSELAEIYLSSTTLDAKNPVYQISAKDERYIAHHMIYTLTADAKHVGVYDEDVNPIDAKNPEEVIVLMMHYLRSNPVVEAPQTNRIGESHFQAIAASFAIEAAIEAGEIDVTRLAFTSGSDQGTMYTVQSIESAKAMGVTIDGKHYAYTKNEASIKSQLAERAELCLRQFASQPLPPASTQEQ